MNYLLIDLFADKTANKAISPTVAKIGHSAVIKSGDKKAPIYSYFNLMLPIIKPLKINPVTESQMDFTFGLMETPAEEYDENGELIPSLEIDDDMLFTINELVQKAAKLGKIDGITIVATKVITRDDITTIHSDGSVHTPTKRGSYGVVNEETLEVFYEAHDNGTNNTGELTGLKKALEIPVDTPYKVICSDSQYSLKTYREWLYSWVADGKKGYANEALINETQALIESQPDMKFIYKWTKGHDGEDYNEICDRLAKLSLYIDLAEKAGYQFNASFKVQLLDLLSASEKKALKELIEIETMFPLIGSPTGLISFLLDKEE